MTGRMTVLVEVMKSARMEMIMPGLTRKGKSLLATLSVMITELHFAPAWPVTECTNALAWTL